MNEERAASSGNDVVKFSRIATPEADRRPVSQPLFGRHQMKNFGKQQHRQSPTNLNATGSPTNKDSSFHVVDSLKTGHASANLEIISYVLPFHYSVALSYTTNATPESGIREHTKSPLCASTSTGGFIYLNFKQDPACARVDEYTRTKLAPYFDSLCEQYASESQPFDQVTALANTIKDAFQTDVEKVRAMFLWICMHVEFDESALNPVQNVILNILNSDKPFRVTYDPSDVMNERKSASEGYANLFVALCQKIGIHAVKIKGFARGFSSKVGTRYETNNHAWNAVELFGKWYLLDICWSRGHVESYKFVDQFDDRYFFMDPRNFLFDHYPTNIKWILSEPGILKEDFEDYAITSSVTSSLGAYPVLKEHMKGVITVARGYVIMPFNTDKPVMVYVHVLPLTKDTKAARRFNMSARFQCVQHYEHGGFKVFILFPYPGSYNVLIYAKEREELVVNTNEYENRLTYSMIFEYLIESLESVVYDVGLAQQTDFLPSFGGRIESPIQGTLTKGATYNFRLRIRGFVMIMVRIGEKIGSYLLNEHNDPELFQADIAVQPDPLEYYEGITLRISGNRDHGEGWITLAVYTVVSELPELPTLQLDWYKVESRKRQEDITEKSVEMVPLETEIEEESAFKIFSPIAKSPIGNLGIELLSHQLLWISGSTGGYTIAIRCQNKMVKLEVLPLEQFGTPTHNKTTWISMPRPGEYFIRAECPIPGIYVLKVRATIIEREEIVNRFIALRYVIDCSTWNMQTKDHNDKIISKKERLKISFPEESPGFIERKCALFEPTSVLIPGQKYKFKVYIPFVEEVGIFISGDWIPLTRLDSHSIDNTYLSHTFEGEIRIPAPIEKSILNHVPFVSLCTQESNNKSMDPTADDLKLMNRMLDFQVAASETDSLSHGVLGKYDEETIIDPSPEMLKHIRFMNLKHKKVLFNTKENEEPVLSFQFKRVEFETKYLDKGRYKIKTNKKNMFFENMRDRMVDKFDPDYQYLLETMSDEDTDEESEEVIVVLKASLFDEVNEVANAVLVQHDQSNLFADATEESQSTDAIYTNATVVEYHQVKVMLPRPGKFMLKIRVISIDLISNLQEEHEGVNYWIHHNEHLVQKQSDDASIISESEHDKDLTLINFQFGREAEKKAEIHIRQQKDAHGYLAEDNKPIIPLRKQQILAHAYRTYFQGAARDPLFGFVQIDAKNQEWFRPMIYEPQSIVMQPNVMYRVKARIAQADGVMMCSSFNTKLKRRRDPVLFHWEKEEMESRSAQTNDTYYDWQQLDSSHMRIKWGEEDETGPQGKLIIISDPKYDHIHGPDVYEGIVSFKRGETVHIMARYGFEHFVSIATWTLLPPNTQTQQQS